MEAGSLPALRAPKLLFGLPLGLLAALIGVLLAITVMFGATPSCGGEAVGALSSKVPRRLVPIYEQAAAKYGLGEQGPSILAGINWVETGFGTNLNVSSAGAQGWMQFMPETWAAYGVDANGDGVKDPDNPEDAIFAAANYLKASGMPGDVHGAIFAYNHAEWYVADVLAHARRFAGEGTVETASTGGCAAAAGAPNETVGRMVAEADRLSALRPTSEYVWGGSHGSTPTPANGPFDCSSAVSHLFQVGGFDNPTMDTTLLVGWGEPGPGRWVTIFVKPYGGDAHTFLRFTVGVTPPGKRYWGTSGIVAPGKGPGWIGEDKFSASYLGGFELRHPPGL